MSTTGTNEFAILNLSQLSSNYRLFAIQGLKPDSDDERCRNDYYQNSQFLIKKLSFKLRQPITIIERDGEPFLVVPERVLVPTSQMVAGGKEVYFNQLSETFTLDYTDRSPENDKICLRFLEFLIQTPLHSHWELWQPKSGAPFFKRKPENPEEDILHFLGYRVRPVITADGGIALRVHIANKYASSYPLAANITRSEFNRFKDNHFIYHYGYQWYEIAGLSFNDLNVSRYKVTTKDNRRISLLEYAVEDSKKPIPMKLAQVKPDTAVLNYFNNNKDERAAIASLCYRVYGPQDAEARWLHRQSIQSPDRRRLLAINFANNYLSDLHFGDTKLDIDPELLSVPTKMFSIPDFEFGNSQILSVKGTKGAIQTSLEELGEARLNLLKDKKAGLYDTKPLGRQYFVIPESVKQSWGDRLLEMLKSEVDDFTLQENGYEPIVVSYNDLVERTFLEQSKAILRAVEEKCTKPGHALVMTHHLPKLKNRDEDVLAAMVVRELRERFDITAAVIHTKTGEESFDFGKNSKGESEYIVAKSARGKLSGYVQLVALNKILLLNERCPFTLATKLNADLVIGIDVKANTAGFILIDGYGRNYRFKSKTSKQKEKLRADQTEVFIYELVCAESQTHGRGKLKNIVIHRDGRLWASEKSGIKRAFARLKREGVVSPEATLTILEIPKSAIVPLRFFEIIEKNGFTKVINPQIGQYEIRGDEGYLCTTGRAFRRAGTSLPLHVRKVEGEMSLEQCLEDVFYLSNLTWTKPNDCSREPITIRLTDRFLKDEATAYDAESLEYGLISDYETEEEREEAA